MVTTLKEKLEAKSHLWSFFQIVWSIAIQKEDQGNGNQLINSNARSALWTIKGGFDSGRITIGPEPILIFNYLTTNILNTISAVLIAGKILR